MIRYRLPSTRDHKVAPPTLLVWGTKDGALEQKTAELSGRYVEDLTLEWVEGASHWVQQEEPVLVNAAIRRFLSAKAHLA